MQVCILNIKIRDGPDIRQFYRISGLKKTDPTHSSSPIFTFPFVFNHFPEHFKEIMERKDFREKLDMYYIVRFKNPNCIKRNCKFCHYFDYKMKQLNFAISYSSKSYS